MQTVPGGSDKGKPWSEIDEKAITYWAEKATNPAAKAAAQEELRRRTSGGGEQSGQSSLAERPRDEPRPQPAQRPQPTALAVAPVPKSLGRAMHDPGAVNEQLVKLAESYHLVSPVTRFDSLPEGFGVSFSMVQINPDPNAGEVYKVDGGKLALSHNALNRIAAAAELSWDAERSRRLDDGSDSCYCHYRAVGYVRSSDGSPRTVTGEVEIDMRPGSPDVKAAKSDTQISQVRRFILRHAESKAKNRAISCMGVKRSYMPDELRKPFAVTRLQFTGHSDDPDLRREFARIRAEQVMGAHRALYGAAPRAALPPSDGMAPHAPPPLDAAFAVSDDGEVFDEEGRY